MHTTFEESVEGLNTMLERYFEGKGVDYKNKQFTI